MAVFGTGRVLSMAITVKPKLPEMLGAPLNTPALESETPNGGAPEVICHVMGGVPLVAVNTGAAYNVPNFPSGRDVTFIKNCA